MNVETVLQYKHPQEDDAIRRLEKHLVNDEYMNQICEMYKTVDEENLLPDMIGKAVEINEYQMPEVYAIFQHYCDLLKMKVPKIYSFEGMFVEVNAEGLDKPWVQIIARTFDICDKKELSFLIARQLIHIKLGHMKHEILCEQFDRTIQIAQGFGSSFVGFIPGGGKFSEESFDIFTKKFKLISARWFRVTEYTADRCALALTDWDIKTAVSAIKKQIFNSKKLADMVRMSEYLMQTRTILSLKSPVAKYSIMDEQCPYGPFRIKELISFASTHCIDK